MVVLLCMVYIFAVYASCAHLNNLWTNMCGLVSRHASAFGTVGPCMCNEVWKVWGGQSVRSMLKEFRGCVCGFELHRTRGYGRYSRRLHALFASQGDAALSCTHHSRSRLHGVVAAFVLSVFSSVFAPDSYLLLSPITIFAILSLQQSDC